MTGSPAVLSLLSASGTMIIGGTGLIAVRDPTGTWQTSNPAIGAIAALITTSPDRRFPPSTLPFPEPAAPPVPEPAAPPFPEPVEGSGRIPLTLITGGPLGIGRSVDHGRTWQLVRRTVPVTCLARSGDLLLAGTLGAGVLRSTDDGLNWADASAGLPDDHVSALTFQSGSALAATDRGLCRSAVEGRVWRQVPGTPTEPITALWADADHSWALTESGRVFGGYGDEWREVDRLPDEAVPSAVLSIAGRLLAATSAGLYDSAAGARWQRRHDQPTYALADADGLLLAGTASGLAESRDAGVTWCPAPFPALDDVSRLLPVGDRVLAYGPLSGLLETSLLPDGSSPGGAHSGDPLPGAPLPMITAAAGPDAVLLAAGPEGLARSADAGRTWQQVGGELGAVSALAPDRDGGWWAIPADGSRLLRSADRGLSWTATATPWGTSTPLALGVVGTDLLVATRDGLGTGVDLWRGPAPDRLIRTGRLPADPDRVLISLDPPAAVIDDRRLIPGPNGWRRIDGPPGTIRRLIGTAGRLLALTDRGLSESPDGGANWHQLLEADLRDAVITNDATLALDRTGTVWRTSQT
ncbi:hypothetical protein [Microlunatus sp. GCM10028923]|uniref:hypothetical protein n=1 Tax=Microlunatus sp. GCM10028923 TaxID=3273400 RepID=UPI00360EB3D8